MQDVGVVQLYTYTISGFGEPIQTFTDQAAIVCGLEMNPGTERHGPDNTQTEYDAIARLPIATVIASKDRLKITKRYAETLAVALVFEVLSPVRRGPSGVRVLLRRIET
jgi:hypothetical protein